MDDGLRPLVLYHGGGCSDGFCAAFIARSALPDAEFLAVNYGEPPPDVAGRKVYILDFSYKRDVLLAMAKSARSLTVLDHHLSAQQDLADLPPLPNLFVRFDMAKSGAMLAWEWFYPGEEPPLIVRYVQDRDLWKFELESSREVNAALRSFPFDFDKWDQLSDLLERRFGQFITEGAAILRAESQVVANHVKNAKEVEIAGYRVLAVNATTLVSEIAGELARGRPFGCCWFWSAERGKFICSLRSREGGVNVCEVAKSLGGGGHPAAAGYQSDVMPMAVAS